MHSARTKAVDPHTEGELHTWGGVVSAYLVDWTNTLDVSPETLVRLLEEESINPLVDTAVEKGGSEKAETRPTDPDRRCLALTREDAERLRSVCDKADPEDSGAGSTQCTLALTTQDRESAMNGTKSEDLRVRVTPSTYSRVEAEAKRSGQTMSDVVRHAVRDRVGQATETLGAADDPGLSDRSN